MIYDANGEAFTTRTRQPGAYQAQRLLASVRSNDFNDGWRRMGGHPLLALNQDEILLRAYTAYMLSPLGGGMIEKPVDILIGNGFDFKSENGAVEDALRRFWEHPVNNFPWNQDRRAAELAVFGEQCYSLHVNRYTKDVQLGYIHPYAIERTIVDPENSEVVIGVKLKGDGSGAQILKNVLSPDYPDEELYSKAALKLRKGFTTKHGPAECMFFAINERTIVNGDGYDTYGPSLRGTSDLLPALDWIFASDDFLSSMLERADLASRILWDVTYDGASQQDIDNYNAATPIPDKHTINTHNEKITWNMITPDLKASEHETGFRMIRNFTISGKGGGFPGHWFGDGGDVNRATAGEMFFPTIKHLVRRQWKLMEMFRRLMSYQLVQKHLPTDFEMIAPTISEKDMERVTKAITQLTSNLVIAEDRGWLSGEEARAVFRTAMEDLGTELADDEPEPSEEDLGESSSSRVTKDYENADERRGMKVS